MSERSSARAMAVLHLRDLLRAAILSGSLVDARGALPSEAALILQFETSRNIVRDALGLLRDEGLVERLQGAGTFVASGKVNHRFNSLRGGRRRGTPIAGAGSAASSSTSL